MYYKLTLEKLDYDKNVIKTTTVMLAKEFVEDGGSVDYLKLAADELIDKFRYEHNEKLNKNEQNT